MDFCLHYAIGRLILKNSAHLILGYLIVFSSLLSVYRTFDAWDHMLVLAMIMKSTDCQLLVGKPEIVWFCLFNALAFSSHIPNCNHRRLKYFALK
jgi:hypothetical protein